MRGLEKRLSALVREVHSQNGGKGRHGRIGKREVEEMLVSSLQAGARSAGRGVVTGLAWTAMGGATLNIESSKIRHCVAALS